MSEGDLGFFVLLAQRGSFVATAREMGVTASAVSRRLARLEDRLGVRLMNRTTRRVSLTGEGEAYFTKAARLLAEIEDLESSLRAGRDTPSGLLRINATFGFSRQHIAPVIQEYCATYSGIDVQLVVTDAPMNLVEQGVDLNIRFGDPPTSNLVQRLLQRNRRFMCASPEYLDRHGTPASLQDLGRHDCIVLRQEHDLYDVWRFDDLGRQSPSARVGGRLSTNDGDIAREWMLGGRGIMLRSEWDIARHVRQGRLRVVLPDYCQTANIAAIYPERHHLAAKVRVFVDLLAERIRASDAHDPMQLTAAELRPRQPGLCGASMPIMHMSGGVPMDLALLEDFLELAREMNFSRAAANRNMTQPAFSRRIRALEDAMQTPLVTRTTRQVALTPAGAAFHPRAAAIIRQLADARAEALETAGRAARSLNLAATHALSYTFIPRWLMQVADPAEFGALNMVSDTQRQCLLLMQRAEASFFICHRGMSGAPILPERQFLSQVIGRDDLVPLSASDVSGRPRWRLGDAGAPVIAYGPASGLHSIIDAHWARHGRPDMAPAMSSILAATNMEMAKAGHGIAFLPASLAEGDMQAGHLIQAGGPADHIPVEIAIYRPRSRLSPHGEAFWQKVLAWN